MSTVHHPDPVTAVPWMRAHVLAVVTAAIALVIAGAVMAMLLVSSPAAEPSSRRLPYGGGVAPARALQD